MKINGPTQAQLSIYKERVQQQVATEKSKMKEDKLEISTAAQTLQKGNMSEKQRAQYVNDIKQSYENGTYKVQPEKLAEKMIDFWSKGK